MVDCSALFFNLMVDCSAHCHCVWQVVVSVSVAVTRCVRLFTTVFPSTTSFPVRLFSTVYYFAQEWVAKELFFLACNSTMYLQSWFLIREFFCWFLERIKIRCHLVRRLDD